MSKNDWRTTANKVNEPLVTKIWYRSPWWGHDHLLGEAGTYLEDGIAWCGRPLREVRDWDVPEIGGLYYSTRTSARCADCRKRQKEWEAAIRFSQSAYGSE